MHHIIDCTDRLKLSSKQQEIFKCVAEQLHEIKKLDPKIVEIGIAGGFIVDTLLGLDPYDLDLKYRLKDSKGEPDPTCKCDYIRKLVDKTSLHERFEVDVGHVMDEQHPNSASIISEHVGALSLHTEYYSMWVLDENGRIWTNNLTFKDFEEGTYNSHPLGFMAWVYHKKRTYYDVLAVHLIRGLGYIRKRNLNMGDVFKLYLSNSPTIFNNFQQEEFDHDNLKKYFYKKVISFDELEKLVNKSGLENSEEIFNVIKSYVQS